MRIWTWSRVIGFAAALAFAGAGSAGAQSASSAPTRATLAALVPAGKAVIPGDLLRTTRLFPNWNLNCEVLLSEGRHLCAVETRSVDAQGRLVFAWSIALGADGTPVMVFKVPANIDRTSGIRMTLGAFSTNYAPKPDECAEGECRVVAPFDATLRTLAFSQPEVMFAMRQGDGILQVRAPLAGLADALATARRDPVGLLAAAHRETRQASVAAPTPVKRGTAMR